MRWSGVRIIGDEGDRVKHGESAPKTGTSASKKGESSKKRFGKKAKPPPPAPRQPRTRQRLSVTVLGLPNADRPLFEDPLLADPQGPGDF